MTPRIKKYAFVACAGFLAFCTAFSVLGQTSPNTKSLRDQLRMRYDIVALRDGVGFVPHRHKKDIRLIEIRNGVIDINGNAVSASEAREQLGHDADLILQVTYLDASAQQDLARPDSGANTTRSDTETSTNEPVPTSPERTQVHHGDLVHIGGGVTVARDELIQGDVVAIGGSADVDGEVRGDVVAIGGGLNLGPDAVVKGDAVTIGGALNRSPGARISGDVTDIGVGSQLSMNRRLGHKFSFWEPFSQLSGLLGALLRVALMVLSALVVAVLGGRYVETIADRAAAEPLRSGLAGLLAEVLFVPMLIVTIVVLAVSIIGIPVLLLVPFGIVLAFVLMFIGFTGIACLAGRLVSDRFSIKRGPYISVALGVVVIVGITLIAKIIGLAGGFLFGAVIAGPLTAFGYFVEYVAWTMGIGAYILTWLSNRRRGAPPTAAAPPVTGAAILPNEAPAG